MRKQGQWVDVRLISTQKKQMITNLLINWFLFRGKNIKMTHFFKIQSIQSDQLDASKKLSKNVGRDPKRFRQYQ